MNMLGEMLGEICKIVLPIPQESYRGNSESSVAVCTLSDINLLQELAIIPDVLQHVNIIGRLLSENKGIDAMLKFLYENPCVRTIIICGVDTQGHRAGHSLFCLHEYGISNNIANNIQNKILNSHSPDPYLYATFEQIKHFCQNVSIIDMTGISDRAKIIKCVKNYNR